MARKLTLMHSQFSYETKGLADVVINENDGDIFGTSTGDTPAAAAKGRWVLPDPQHGTVTLRLKDSAGDTVQEKFFRRNVSQPQIAAESLGITLWAQSTGGSADVTNDVSYITQNPAGIHDSRIAYKVAPDLFSTGMMEIELAGKLSAGLLAQMTQNSAGGHLFGNIPGAGVVILRIPFKVEDV
jgi:hypothetical protein